MKKLIVLICFLPLSALASQTAYKIPTSCLTDPKIQEAREKELKQIYNEDQSDRTELEAHLDKPWPPEKMLKIAEHDLQHRRRTAEIFAEGCFKTAADYAEAAMVFQHGTVPFHFYQTFLWAKEAVNLGDESETKVMAMGIDRYLVNINQRQLFGTQAKKINADDLCWCLWPMEKSFSDSMRSQYKGRTQEEALAWTKKINGNNACPSEECKVETKATPPGSIPGFW